MKKIFNTSIPIIIFALAFIIIQCNGNSFEDYKKERLVESHVLTPDNTPPSIANANATANNKVTIVFSEELNTAAATDPLNYHIQGNNRVDVLGGPDAPVLNSPDNNTVTLTVSTSPNYRMQQGKSYTLLVQNVSDISNNKIIYSFATFLGIGPVVSEIWRDTVKMPESGPYSYINSTSMDLTIKGTNVDYYQYSFDGSVWSSEIPVSSHIILSSLSEGYHSIKVIGKDNSGLWQDANQATTTGWTTDVTPPTALLSHIPANVTALSDIDIVVSGSDVSTYRYKINSESYSSYVSKSNRITRTDLPDGDYILYVIARDEAGNEQSSPTTCSWTISQSMLVAVLLNTPIKNTNITFTDIIVSGTDVLYYEYSLDNGLWSLITGIGQTIRLTDLPDGQHTLKVRGFIEPLEFGGQPEDSATEYTWTVDTIDPVCILSNLPANFTNSQNTYITVAGDAAKYRYRVNSGTLSGQYNVSDPIELLALGEGSYTIKVMGIDEAGNEQNEANSTNYTWTVDMTPPRAVLSGTPANPSQVSSINITVGGVGAVAYKYNLDSDGWTGEISNISQSVSRVGLSEGSHTLSVVVRDTAGNWQSMQNSTDCVWIIDTNWPTAVLTDTPALVTNIQSADITVTGVGVYKYEYSIDGSPYSTERELVTYPGITLSDLIVGSHTISVIACDRAGNWQPELNSTSYTWTIDTDIPTAVLSNKPSAKTNSQSINITVGGNIVSYKYRIDGGAWDVETVIATPISLSGLSESSHTIDVIGKKTGPDQWQTVANATTYSWIIDITSPAAVLLTKPANPTSSQSASIQISGIGGVNTYRYSLDNPGIYGSDILLSENDTIALINLSAGDHTIYVLAKDVATNEQASPTTYTWTVDTSVPVAVLSNTPANPTNLQSMDITVGGTNIVSYKYRIDGGTWSSEIDIVTHISRVGMTAGNHTVSAVGKNAAGTWQDIISSTDYTWIIDISAPTASDITFSNLPANPTNSTSADVTVGGVGIVKYMYKLDSGSWNSETVVANHIILSGLLSPQSHTLYVIGCDAAGNWLNTSSAKTYTWSVDDTQAIAVMSNVPANPTNSQSANITIGGVEDYRFRLDAGAWDDNGGSYYSVGTYPNINLSGLSETSHTIEVSGRNATHVEQSSPTTYTWTIDITPPAASLSNLPVNHTYSTSANITVDGTGVVAYQYKVDAGIWLPSGSEKSVDFSIVLSGLSVGSHTIYVKGKDNAGNWQLDGIATSYSWIIDQPPLISPTVYDEGTNSTNSLLTFTWIKPDGTQDVKIQIAADSGFSDIIYGGTNGVSIGNVSFYQFIVTATDKQAYFARVSVNSSTGIPVSDPSWKAWGTASDGINIVGSVSGRVKDGISTSDVSGAQVDIMKMSDSSLIATTTTDSTGNFAFGNIPIGVNYYKLAISKATYNNTGKNNITVSQGDETNVGILFLILTSATAGTISGDVVNANDGVDVASATISVYTWDSVLQTSTTTNSTGDFSTSSVPAGVYSVKVTKAGFFDLLVDNVAINGNKAIGTQALCEVLQEPQVRVVLLWGATPEDLDLHLVGPTTKTLTTGNTGVNPNNRFHTYWSSQKSFNESTGTYYSNGDPGGVRSTASLVQDDTTSYGPEAQNLFRWGGGQFARGYYTYTVHRWYSSLGSTWGTIPITMRIYDSQGMARELNFPGPPSTDLTYWKAFKINIQGNSRAQRSIIILNQFGTLDYSTKSTLDW
jgi:hypothetical protein